MFITFIHQYLSYLFSLSKPSHACHYSVNTHKPTAHGRYSPHYLPSLIHSAIKCTPSLVKAAHLVDNTNRQGHFQKVLTAFGNFCIYSIAFGIVVEMVMMYPIQRRKSRDGINNLSVFLIGRIPIAMPTVLSVTMAIGFPLLSKQGASTKRMTAIEEMAGMDVLCRDKTGTLTFNKLTVDKSMIEIFSKDVDSDVVILLAARASRVENQDTIDACIVGMLADPGEDKIRVSWRTHS